MGKSLEVPQVSVLTDFALADRPFFASDTAHLNKYKI
jgi:hypothetical protein